MSEDALSRVRRLRQDADAIVAELSSAERPSTESVGIAWVHADALAQELDEWERDLLSEYVAPSHRRRA